MHNLNPVIREIKELVVNRPLSKGQIPHLEIVALYVKYELEERRISPHKNVSRIRTEFANLFHRTIAWTYNYVAIAALHPTLLKEITTENGQLTVPFADAVKLGRLPESEQREFLHNPQGKTKDTPKLRLVRIEKDLARGQKLLDEAIDIFKRARAELEEIESKKPMSTKAAISGANPRTETIPPPSAVPQETPSAENVQRETQKEEKEASQMLPIATRQPSVWDYRSSREEEPRSRPANQPWESRTIKGHRY